MFKSLLMDALIPWFMKGKEVKLKVLSLKNHIEKKKWTWVKLF